ncbi:MAG TPA: hypothetical protein VKT32_16955 [Chthonomonadaceae bacterium]|nr:hypothetical protein [Chthonomonadaceae bacterium]
MAFDWEVLEMSVDGSKTGRLIWRAPVPGGWLAALHSANGTGLTFYPDPDHVWDGSSLQTGALR